MRGEFEVAQSFYLRALEMEPRNAEANFLYGSLAYQAGEYQISYKLLKSAARISPSRADYHNNLGLALQSLGKTKKAGHAFRRAIKLQPRFSDAINNLGTIMNNIGAQGKAEELFREALDIQPNFIEAWSNLGGIFTAKGDLSAAIECNKRALEIDSSNALLHFNLGVSFQAAGQDQQALEAYLKAASINPKFTEAHQNSGVILKELGRFEEAIRAFRKALDINPESVESLYSLSGSQKFISHTSDVTMMENLFSQSNTSIFNKIQLGFALGKIYEDLKQYDTAFAYFEQANQLKRNTLNYSVDQDIRSIESIISVFDHDFFKLRNGFGSANCTPIFVIGMPRSGTSLTEQILSNHPAVYGAGEIFDMPNVCFSNGKIAGPTFTNRIKDLKASQIVDMAQTYLMGLRSHSDSADRIVDKLPENFLYVGMIKLLFPRAKVVHCRRNPLDTCLSNFKNNFEIENNYAYDQKELGEYYSSYWSLMDHWKDVLPGFVYDLQYEDLVRKPEQVIKGMLEYCELDFHVQCLDFHRSRRSVKTASVFQVRQPIYRSSIKSWSRYEKHLAPLINVLDPLL